MSDRRRPLTSAHRRRASGTATRRIAEDAAKSTEAPSFDEGKEDDEVEVEEEEEEGSPPKRRRRTAAAKSAERSKTTTMAESWLSDEEEDYGAKSYKLEYGDEDYNEGGGNGAHDWRRTSHDQQLQLQLQRQLQQRTEEDAKRIEDLERKVHEKTVLIHRIMSDKYEESRQRAVYQSTPRGTDRKVAGQVR